MDISTAKSLALIELRAKAWLLLLTLVCYGAMPAAAQEEVTLNLKDADIRTLIETVSAATGTNFVIDPRVKAKVTVISSQPMNGQELYQVFLSILQVHGFSAVRTGEVVKIVPDVNAKQGPVAVTEAASPGRGDELVTRVIPIHNVPAAQMVPILRPLVPQQGHLAAYAASNALIISDRAANISRLAKIIKRIDRPDSQEIEVIPLRNASAQDVVRIVSSLRQVDAKGGQVPGQPVLAADERTNSVLLGGDRTARLRIRSLIAHLDTPLESGGNTHVVFLKYAQATELAPILLGVSQQQISIGATTTPGATTRVPTTPATTQGAQQQQQAAAAQAAQRRAITTRARAGSTSGAPEIDIQADERNNALIITAPQDQFESIRAVIRQLDIRRAQVLVESIIAEVRTDLAQNLGLSFFALPAEGSVGLAGAFAPSTVGSIAAAIVDSTAENLGRSLSGLSDGLVLGGADLREGNTQFAVLLEALASDTATNILSTPTLVTLDNEEAEIVVGQNVPFITGSFTSAAQDATNPFQTIERRDVGITLRITPQINEGNSVKLDIEQESSSVAAAATGASDIVTNTRSIRTSVLVEDDDVLVLGGLIDDTCNDTQNKVPVLGDVPLLGRLFRNDRTQKTKQSLMVFIHPKILRDSTTANAYSGAKYSLLRARQLESDIQNRGLIKDPAGNLPDLDDVITRAPRSTSLDLNQELNRELE
ncbi:MAG: type II secretion system secretin GspD [Gammaproteobacteria bacterium]